MENAVILYIIKSGICIVVFLTIYMLFLRKNTFFRFNRIFLTTGLIASLIIPAIKYTYDVFIPNIANIEVISQTESDAIPTPGSAFSIWSILFMLYIAGIILLSIRNLFAYRKLTNLIKGGTKHNTNGVKLIESNEVKSPFTVLNYILLNSKSLSSTERDLILKHEITHINQKHWIDLICSEIILLLQWFNPLAWKYVSLLKENHEFLADKAVIDSGISPYIYQAVLINQRFQGPVFSFSNSFNYSKPLNRLSMIKKSKSASWKRISALIIIPILGLFIWASAEPNYIIQESVFTIQEFNLLSESPVENTVITTNDSVPKKEKKVTVSTNTKTDTKVKTKKSVDTIFHIGQKGTILSYKSNGENDSITRPIRIQIKGMGTLNGQNSTLFTNRKKLNGDIQSVSVTKNISSITVFKKEDKKNEELHSGLQIKSNNSEFKKIEDKDILFIVDGKEEPIEKLGHINPNTIESISVIKDATSIYGNKAKDGVIIVNLKKI